MSSVCSIITTASAPRGMTPPVAIAVAVPGITSIAGATPHAITSALSVSRLRRAIAGADAYRRRARKAVDIGAVERRRIDRRDDIGRKHAGETRGQRQRFGGRAASDRYRPRNAGALPAAETTSRNCSCRAARAHRVENRRAAVCLFRRLWP